MLVLENQQQFRNSSADVKLFYGAGGTSGQNQRTWTKPMGVSHVYMMLIGGGGDGDNANAGGGSGAVTVWYGAAQHVPDSLVVSPSRGTGNNTTVSYRVSNSTAIPTALLTAAASTGTSAGTAMTANQFSNSGFFQSVAGQNGGLSGIAASPTTFLAGGGSDTSATGNYGYKIDLSASYTGVFMLQPIIVGVGSLYGSAGAVGCGGGYNNGKGGQGLVLIASW
jgi:hypothetical protein